MKDLTVFFLPLFLLLSSCAPGQKRLKSASPAQIREIATDNIASIADGIKTVVYQCPQRIWPGLNLQGIQFILVNDAQQKSWLLNKSESEFFQEIEYKATIGPLSFSEQDGRKTIITQLHDSLNIDFIVHESFHHYFQQNPSLGWLRGSEKESISRATDYPGRWQPRYYRRQIIASLKRAYLESENRDKDLSHVLYWKNKYSSEFPEEANKILFTDRIEGSANYVGKMAEILATIGCKASLQGIKNLFIEASDFWLLKADQLRVDRESYDIGLLAGLILSENGPDSWKLSMNAGSTPLDILLAGRTAATDSEDSKTRDAIQIAMQEQNTELSKLIDPILENMESEKFIRLALPMPFIVGGLRSKSGGMYRTEKKINIFTDVSTTFKSKSGQVSILNSTIVTGRSPCKGSVPFAVLPISSNLFEKRGADYLFSSSQINGKIQLVEATDSSGKKWLCME